MLLSNQLAVRRIAALMMIFVKLRKRHRPQREDQVVNNGQTNQSITLPLCTKRQIADS